MKYSTLLFDADNTLLDFSMAEKKAHEKVSLEHGLPVTDELYNLYSTINDGLWKDYEKGLFTRDEIVVLRFSRYLEAIGRPDVDANVFNIKYREYLGEGKYVIDGAYEVLETLKNMGAKIYVVTNGVSKTQTERLNPQPFFKFIDGVCISEDAGYPKPDVRFFEAATKTFNFKLDENAIIIGDSLSSDIKGGNNVGIKTCWFNPKRKPLLDGYKVDYEITTLYDVIDIVK